MDLGDLQKLYKIQIGEHDGVMVIVCDAQGHITPHVLRLGIMTEGRLEAAIMPIFDSIVKFRARAQQVARANSDG